MVPRNASLSKRDSSKVAASEEPASAAHKDRWWAWTERFWRALKVSNTRQQRCLVVGGRGLGGRLSGADHPNWKGGRGNATYRKIGIEAHGQACQRCGSTENINVHHRDRNRQNNDPSNLEVVCRSCHNKEHDLGGNIRHTTHCPQGHEYTAENTRYATNEKGVTRRHCKECGRERNRRWYWKQRGALDNGV